MIRMLTNAYNWMCLTHAGGQGCGAACQTDRALERQITAQDRIPTLKANGVNLHYLDWGGKGKTLLFLHGMGDCAHGFDDLAPKFADHFRVLGLTPRGHGQSDKSVAARLVVRRRSLIVSRTRPLVKR